MMQPPNPMKEEPANGDTADRKRGREGTATICCFDHAAIEDGQTWLASGAQQARDR
jgi:hypothetical protein